jgi:hypothetical protein
MIDEAITAEERDLLNRIGDEPGFYAQAFAAFRGSTGWVTAVMMAAQTLLFVAGAFAAWRFFEATDPVAQLRWGLPAAVLLLMALIIKMAWWPAIHANRVIRELKRLELHLLRREEAHRPAD